MPTRNPARLLLRLATAAALAVDAYIHLSLAPSQPPGGPGQLSQTSLFYAAGALAIAAALLVLATGARVAYAFAFLVAASALGAVLLYRYVDVGSLGPLPNMYEPAWYTSKITTTLAETVAVLTAAAGALLPHRHTQRRDDHATNADQPRINSRNP